MKLLLWKLFKKENIRISNMGQGKLRVVTHLDYSEEMHQRFLEVLRTNRAYKKQYPQK